MGTIEGMARRPNPDGWQGGSEDFRFVTTQRGHLTPNVFTDPDRAADIDENRNAQSFDEFDYSGGDPDDYV